MEVNGTAESVLKEISGQVADCKACQLSFSRKKAVPGEGPVNAQIVLIGEGPGFYENEQGRPFVGAAGKFLDELLEAAGVSRKEVFITNVVKCRPPGNRDPMPEELAACASYLERQIEVINPLIIVTLGRYSMAKFLPNVRISEVHGQPAWVRGRLIIPMFHPAAALHQPSLKTSVERDFARLPEWIKMAKEGSRASSKSRGVADEKARLVSSSQAALDQPGLNPLTADQAEPTGSAEPLIQHPEQSSLLQDSLFGPAGQEEVPESEKPSDSPSDGTLTQLSLF